MISINVQLSQLQSFGFFAATQWQPRVREDADPPGAENPPATDQQADTLELSQPQEEQLLSTGAAAALEEDRTAASAMTDHNVTIPATTGTSRSIQGAATTFQGFSIQEQRSLSLEIETLDGDVVTIQLDQSSSRTRALLEFSNESGGGVAYQQSLEQATQLDFSVEGNLSREEHHAIKSLMNRLDKLADKFFKGDMEGVMNRLDKLGFNEQQLAGFSFDLNRQQSIQAVSAYYGTGGAAGSDDLTKAVEFTSEMKSLPKPEFMKHPGKSMGKLLAGVIEHKAGHRGHDKPRQDVLQRMEKLLEKTFRLTEPMTT